ncbi:NAD(P)-dependent oxidoreductase [Candidatus Daviesbacteria bacterium]|nr:NAD(P)-dependent oxidoreductase [Candidatus Daviesbacteria bacterium]
MKNVLIFGGSGLVGSKFNNLLKKEFEIISPPASEVDILNQDQLMKILEEENPSWVINFAAITDVEGSEKENGDKDGLCFRVNAIGAQNVAQACKNFNKRLIHISTEYVFDGTKSDNPYTEEDIPNPINWYGQTKLFGEDFVLESGCEAIIMRISMPFTSHYKLKKDIARFFLEQLKAGNNIKAVEDQRITPTLVNDIVNALRVFLESQSSGIYHVSSRDSVTPLEFAKTIAKTFRLNYSLINSISLDEFSKNKKAKLLKFSWLNPTKFEKEFGDDILHLVEESLVILKQEVLL